MNSWTRHAVATPGDLLFHIRAEREDMCFELAAQIMIKLGNAVTPVDEVHGFRYFDARDLLGFTASTPLSDMLDEVIPWCRHAVADGRL